MVQKFVVFSAQRSGNETVSVIHERKNLARHRLIMGTVCMISITVLLRENTRCLLLRTRAAHCCMCVPSHAVTLAQNDGHIAVVCSLNFCSHVEREIGFRYEVSRSRFDTDRLVILGSDGHRFAWVSGNALDVHVLDDSLESAIVTGYCRSVSSEE